MPMEAIELGAVEHITPPSMIFRCIWLRSRPARMPFPDNRDTRFRAGELPHSAGSAGGCKSSLRSFIMQHLHLTRPGTTVPNCDPNVSARSFHGLTNEPKSNHAPQLAQVQRITGVKLRNSFVGNQ